MRFVRVLAAMAALVCSAVAGQAWALVTLIGSTPTNNAGYASVTLPSAPFLDGTCWRCEIVIKAPSALSTTPQLLYTFHVSPWPPANFASYDKTAATPAYLTAPDTFFTFVPTARWMAPRRIPGLGPAGQRAVASVVGFSSASIDFTGAPNSTIDYNITISAAPEPATWSMLIFGFGAIGGAMRFSRRRAPNNPQGLAAVRPSQHRLAAA